MQDWKALGESRMALGAACDGKHSNLIGRICFHTHALARTVTERRVLRYQACSFYTPRSDPWHFNSTNHPASCLCSPSSVPLACSSSGAHAEAGQALRCPPQLARSAPPPRTAAQAQAPRPSSCPPLPHPPRRGERRAPPPGHRRPSVWSEHATQGEEVLLICSSPSVHLHKTPQIEER